MSVSNDVSFINTNAIDFSTLTPKVSVPSLKLSAVIGINISIRPVALIITELTKIPSSILEWIEENHKDFPERESGEEELFME